MSQSDPVISVVIPCYNAGAFLASAVASALGDEERVATEVIVVDDGSTDDSLARARELVSEYGGKVLVVTQANRGPAAARNAGLRLARGRFIAFLDADDAYAPGFLAEATRRLEADRGMVAVTCGVEFVEAHRAVEAWQRQVIEGTLPGNLLVVTDIARRIGGFPEDPAFRGPAAGEDNAFRNQLPRFGGVAKIEQALYRHRVRRGSHFDRFLDRAVLDGSTIRFNQLLPEEADGTMRAAVERYEEQVRSRVLEYVRETVGKDFRAGWELIQLLGSPPAAREAWTLYVLAKHWPVDGPIAWIGASEPIVAWLEAASRASGRGGITSASQAPARAARLVIVGELASEEQARLELDHWIAALPLHGLVAVRRGPGHDPSAFATRIVTRPAWRVLLRQEGMLVLERVALS